MATAHSSFVHSSYCRSSRPLALWAALVLLTAVALWPALWAGPLRAIEQVRVGVVAEGAEPHMQGNFFLGREDDAPGLLFYPVALALRLTPWTLLGLLLLPLAWRRMRAYSAGAARSGAAGALCDRVRRRDEPVPQEIQSLYRAGLSGAGCAGGGRDLLGIGGWGLGIWDAVAIATESSQIVQSSSRRSSVGLVGAITVASLANVAFWHPYEIAAYNQALGGARAGA